MSRKPATPAANPVFTPEQAAAIAAIFSKPATAKKAVGKPKSQISGMTIYNSLKGLGVLDDVTGTGRTKRTAFCADGCIVTVMLPK